ncbi:hypothetical protein GE061_006622 [Apolygus lucorum]|uniref:Uncharacterized protein n=1 Tax=Apolygus lucorum TaxID=248454 RepID=A0A8S9WVR2_APOLU|nr:hypothetical protein GE061_006622 [Apolygus lucorum]
MAPKKTKSEAEKKMAAKIYREAGHGKGAPDGIGGTVKRTADKLVAQGNDILNVESFIEALSKKLENVVLFQVESSSIQDSIKSLPQNVSSFKGSMKVHQVVWRREVKHLEMKMLSCFVCQYKRKCKHHTIGQHVSRPSEFEDDYHDFEPTTASPVEPPLQQHSYCVSEQEALLTQMMAADGIPHLQEFMDLGRNQPLEDCYEIIGDTNPPTELQENPVDSAHDHPSQYSLGIAETKNPDDLPPKTFSVHSGLCFHCGGSITLAKKGLKCEICDKIAFHEVCKLVDSCSSSDEQPPFDCCRNCISLFNL